MNYGTLKTELWTHYTDVAAEYFRHEIITRWWPDEQDENITHWKTTVLRIDRNGDVRDMLKAVPEWDSLGKSIAEWLQTNCHSPMPMGFACRDTLRKEHDHIVMRCMG